MSFWTQQRCPSAIRDGSYINRSTERTFRASANPCISTLTPWIARRQMFTLFKYNKARQKPLHFSATTSLTTWSHSNFFSHISYNSTFIQIIHRASRLSGSNICDMVDKIPFYWLSWTTAYLVDGSKAVSRLYNPGRLLEVVHQVQKHHKFYWIVGWFHHYLLSTFVTGNPANSNNQAVSPIPSERH